MGKKRVSEDSAESNLPVKKEKYPEFNGTVFKGLLKDPTTAMKGLETFISTAKKLPCTGLYDVVEGYIKISMECTEIFKLLEGEKQAESEMMLIFESLEMILLRTASDLSHFNMVGNAIVKKTVSSYMKCLHSSFHSENHRFVRQCLSFLSALVSQGPEAAREVFSHIYIKALSGLARRKDKRVVLNKAISKTQKVRFFTPAVLSSLASLYKWSGIEDATTDNEDLSGAALVRDLVHNFLLDLCCSRKHGISFHDASFGTVGRAGNIVLLQFLVGLKQATDDELVADLVVNILKASPDILSRYFKETQFSYTPRLKTAWQDNVKLLKKIYEAQPEISTVFHAHEAIPLPRLLSMIMVVSLPPVCNKVFFTQGLTVTVQLTTLSMMNFILKKANKNMEYLLDKSEWHSSDVFTQDMMEDLVQQYRETLSKILPDMTSIVSKWQSLSKKDKPETDGKKAKAEGSVDETAEVILLKALILQVICLYQKVVPHLVNQCKFDFSKLLKGNCCIVSEKGIREEVPPVLQYQILQLALDLPASKFSWFRIQDVADTESSSGEKSVLYLILKMFVSSSTTHLKTSTRMLVLKVLKDSGVFQYTWNELELWLDRLASLEPSQQETVIQFLERVFGKLVSNSHVYTDKVASLVQEAALLQANLSGQEGDGASIPVSHIDDVLDMLDVIMESNDGEMEEFGPPLSEDLIIQTFPFSVVVPAALEARNKLPAGKGKVVCEYLCAVLSDVLHCQRDPLPLCLTLLQYDKELVSSENPAPAHPSIIHLQRYYSKWLPQHSLIDENLRKNVEESLTSMSLAEFPVAIKQMLLYVKSTVENFGTFSKDTGAAVLKNLMGILQDLVIKLQDLQETTITSESAAENSQERSDLFLEINQSLQPQTNKEQILVSALGSIFKHPCMEQWFLALELAALPPHSLNPVRLKRLCAQLSGDILALLKISATTLRDLGHLDVLCSYMSAVERAVLKELTEKSSQAVKRQSQPFQALLSLHSYMDFTHLKEVVSKLLLLPQESLICPSSGETEAQLSVYGHAALQILTESKDNSSQHHSIFLSQAHLHGLGMLLLSCSSPSLEAFLLQTLSSEPGSAKLIHTDVLLHCLQQPLPNSQAISSLLLQNSSTHRLYFEVWCLEPGNVEKLSQQTETFLPLINTYLQVAQRDDPARPKDVKNEVLKTLKKALLEKLSQYVLEKLDENSGVQHTETLSSLIKLSANVNDIKDLISDLPGALQKVDTLERWQLVNVITEELADCPEELETWRKSIITAALKCLIASYSHSKDQATSPSAQEQNILDRLKLTSTGDISASEWNSFVRSGLKYRYRHHHFLTTLCSLVEVMYSGSEAPKDLVPLSTLHMMTSSHSLFLPTMLDCGEEPDKLQTKEALVSLLLCLVKKCPTVCNTSHFVVLLGAYGATLSVLDQKLLLLLQEYERNNVSLLTFQSFMWGSAAVEHHKTRKTLGASLWKQESSDELLALLMTDRMLQTIAHFPQQRKLILQVGLMKTMLILTPLYFVALFFCSALLGNVYDPCFLLPLFSAILRPECVIDCLKFVSSHALGVTVMALSSYDSKLRAAAYHVLSCFYQHLEGARLKEKRQLLYLMDIVKNGVRQKNQRLPFVLTTYISKVAQLMLKPEDHMYVVINRFLLSHQSLDFRRVPEFFKLFMCGFFPQHKLEREWILNVLEEGVSDGHCFELCAQQGIFQSLLGFSSSPLCDDHTQAQIIRVLCRAAGGTKAAYNLTKSCGLLTWMIQVVEKRYAINHLLGAIIDLLHVLWFTNLGQKDKQLNEVKSSSSTDEKPLKSLKCLPLPLISEFLCVAATISRHLRSGVRTNQLNLFLQTFSSALKHYVKALGINKHADRFTLHPQPLSCNEVLALLLCWASLSRDTALITQIQTLSEKHKLKELGMGKDKVRGKGSSSQARTRKEKLSEETETEKQEDHLLTESRSYLSGIFVHWEPVFPLSENQSAQPSQLASDTAHLLTKWSLRCLLESSYDESRSQDFVHWVAKAVMQHREVVDVVLLDSVVKADLLRLYHQAFETQLNSSISARSDTLKLFTSIMMRFLETQGHLPEGHQTVVSACLVVNVPRVSFPEAGLFLSSLYIHELWSGVESPELFLSHVNLVTRVKCKKQKRSKSSLSDAAIRAICNDITMKR
uniref:URB1 ribosome biogenesis homolog n=1 Tax=Sphaeramia orbicularis TaxID=375764 RepID=A0A673CC10_9TELE